MDYLLIVAGSLALLVIGLVALVRAVLQVVTVDGISMTPTYQDGDRLLVLRRGFRRRVRVGVVVVCVVPPGFPMPEDEDDARNALLVKRVAGLPDGRVYVLGDAPRHSLDSRRFGALAPELIRGVVLRPLRLSATVQPPPARPAVADDSPSGVDGFRKR